MKSVITFIHAQQAANGESRTKKIEAKKATGMAMKISTRNQRIAHAHPHDAILDIYYITEVWQQSVGKEMVVYNIFI